MNYNKVFKESDQKYMGFPPNFAKLLILPIKILFKFPPQLFTPKDKTPHLSLTT